MAIVVSSVAPGALTPPPAQRAELPRFAADVVRGVAYDIAVPRAPLPPDRQIQRLRREKRNDEKSLCHAWNYCKVNVNKPLPADIVTICLPFTM